MDGIFRDSVRVRAENALRTATSHKKKSPLQRCRKKMANALHTHIILIILCVLVVIDASCVIGQILCDILIIQDKLEESEVASNSLVKMLRDKYPEHLNDTKSGTSLVEILELLQGGYESEANETSLSESFPPFPVNFTTFEPVNINSPVPGNNLDFPPNNDGVFNAPHLKTDTSINREILQNGQNFAKNYPNSISNTIENINSEPNQKFKNPLSVNFVMPGNSFNKVPNTDFHARQQNMAVNNQLSSNTRYVSHAKPRFLNVPNTSSAPRMPLSNGRTLTFKAKFAVYHTKKSHKVDSLPDSTTNKPYKRKLIIPNKNVILTNTRSPYLMNDRKVGSAFKNDLSKNRQISATLPRDMKPQIASNIKRSTSPPLYGNAPEPHGPPPEGNIHPIEKHKFKKVKIDQVIHHGPPPANNNQKTHSAQENYRSQQINQRNSATRNIPSDLPYAKYPENPVGQPGLPPQPQHSPIHSTNYVGRNPYPNSRERFPERAGNPNSVSHNAMPDPRFTSQNRKPINPAQSEIQPNRNQDPYPYNQYPSFNQRPNPYAPNVPPRLKRSADVALSYDSDEPHSRVRRAAGGGHAEHSLLEELTHIFHLTSMAVLSFLVLVTLLRILSMGRKFIHHKLEVFDAFVVAVSWALDVAFLEGIWAHPGPSAATILLFLLPWRVVRIVNSFVMVIEERGHVKLKLTKQKLRSADKKITGLKLSIERYRMETRSLQGLCRKYSAPEPEINACAPKWKRNRSSLVSMMEGCAKMALVTAIGAPTLMQNEQGEGSDEEPQESLSRPIRATDSGVSSVSLRSSYNEYRVRRDSFADYNVNSHYNAMRRESSSSIES